MHEVTIDYHVEGKTFKGLLIHDETASTQHPGVIVSHAYKGQDAFAKEKGRELVKLGYTAFVLDYYGEGKVVATAEEASALMQPLFVDRATLRKRVVAAYEAFKKLPQVAHDKIGAIGFCFGGLAVIELLRSGAGVKGSVSFHGIFGSQLGGMQAKVEPNRYAQNTSILLLNGYEDPMLPEKDVSAFQKELNEAGIDWQMNTYGHTKHAFMVPGVNEGPLKYNPMVAKRAWRSMELFFQEVLK